MKNNSGISPIDFATQKTEIKNQAEINKRQIEGVEEKTAIQISLHFAIHLNLNKTIIFV